MKNLNIGKRYIGVTGFKEIFEMDFAKSIIQELNLRDSTKETKGYRLMLGVLSSSKRLDNPDISGTKSPALKDLRDLGRRADPWAIKMIHYHTTNMEGFAEEVEKVFAYANGDSTKYFSGVQLNMAWPDPSQVERIRSKLDLVDVVLQIPKRASEGLLEKEIISKVLKYNGLVDYVLIDPSGGKGEEFELEKVVSLMEKLRVAMSWDRMDATIGVAGGLSPENIAGKIRQIKENYKDPFCIDAQGKLMKDGRLVMERVESYVRNASLALRLA